MLGFGRQGSGLGFETNRHQTLHLTSFHVCTLGNATSQRNISRLAYKLDLEQLAGSNPQGSAIQQATSGRSIIDTPS